MLDSTLPQNIKIHYLCDKKINSWFDKIENFEKKFSFNLANNQMFRSHMGCYAHFYSAWEQPRFVVGETQDAEVACLLTLAKKNVWVKGQIRSGVYLCDFKIAPDLALSGLRHTLFKKMLLRIPLETLRWRCSFAFFATAIRPRKSLAHTLQKQLLGRLTMPLGVYELFSATRSQILSLNAHHAPDESFQDDQILNLNHHSSTYAHPSDALYQTHENTRQFKFKQTGEIFHVAHIQANQALGRGFIEVLQAAAHAAPPEIQAFWFGLDSRRVDLVGYLNQAGLVPFQRFSLAVGTLFRSRFNSPIFVLNSSEL